MSYATQDFLREIKRALRALVRAAEVAERFTGAHLTQQTPDGPAPRPRTVRRDVNRACESARRVLARSIYAAAYVAHEEGNRAFIPIADELAEVDSTFRAMERSVGRFRCERNAWHAETAMYGLRAIRLLSELVRRTRPRRASVSATTALDLVHSAA